MTPMSKRKGYGWMEKKKKPVDPGPGMEWNNGSKIYYPARVRGTKGRKLLLPRTQKTFPSGMWVLKVCLEPWYHARVRGNRCDLYKMD